jgi:non-ribosomal peptide synthetase component F
LTFVLWAAYALVIAALLFVPVMLASKRRIEAITFKKIAGFLLMGAGIIGALNALIAVAAASWGMDTRLPYGSGALVYLLPVLGLPAFVLLTFASAQVLAWAQWSLAIGSALSFPLNDYFERAASGVPPRTSAEDIFGMLLNGFTLILIAVAVLVQLAAFCQRREKAQPTKTVPQN